MMANRRTGELKKACDLLKKLSGSGVAYRNNRAGTTLWRYPAFAQTTALICRYHRTAALRCYRALPWPERRIARRLAGARRNDWVMGRWLAHRALNIQVGRNAAMAWIDCNSSGAPVLRKAGQIPYSISISHIDGWVCAAVRRACPVGIDVESGRCLPREQARYFLSVQEIGSLQNTAQFPLSAWVAKEAAYKALRCAAPLGLKDLHLDPLQMGRRCSDGQRYAACNALDGRKVSVKYRHVRSHDLHVALAGV